MGRWIAVTLVAAWLPHALAWTPVVRPTALRRAPVAEVSHVAGKEEATLPRGRLFALRASSGPVTDTDEAVGGGEEAVAVTAQAGVSVSAWFEAALEAAVPDTGLPPQVVEKRSEGKTLLPDHNVPQRKQEAWRFNNIQTMFAIEPSTPADSSSVSSDALAPYMYAETAGATAVFVDGVFRPELSDLGSVPDNVVFGAVSSVGDRLSETHLGMLDELPEVKGSDHRTNQGAAAFAALNQACFVDSACIYVPDGVQVEQPVEVLFVSTASTSARPTSYPRAIIAMGKDAELSLVQSYATVGGDKHFTNGLTVVAIDENAKLDHFYVQDVAAGATHYDALIANVSSGGEHKFCTTLLGGEQSRLNCDVHLNGDGARAEVVSVLVTDNRQMADFHSSISHHVENTTSFQQQRNILGGRSDVVFRGRIKVDQEAQNTDSEQLCRSLLLTDRAKITVMPSLEIIADQVVCTHGATVADLSADELFYLQSRGLTPELARALLTKGFVREFADRFTCKDALGQLDDKIEKLVKEVRNKANKSKYNTYTSV